jgi:hypothetical protein
VDFLSISTGLAAKDLCGTACETRDRYWDLIKNLKLKTFSSLKKEAVIKETAKEIVLKKDNRVIGHMLLITQIGKLI